MTQSQSLPIDELQAPFTRALGNGHVVVTAATGTGKSRRLPVWAAAAAGPTLVVEPRRVAATSLANRVAADCGGEPGDHVGYAVRLDARHGHETQILFATPGVALRWLGNDGLAGFRSIILDEFHERRWDTDLLLALLTAAERHQLVLTSATLDGERLARHLDARLLDTPGQGHPVTVEHRAADPREMPSSRDLDKRMADAIRDARHRTDGDVLAFLPGRGEIAATAKRLSADAIEPIQLHGSASVTDQRRALEPGKEPRVVLATNVAESALTVPGVTAVVDSGLERRTGQRNGRTVLALQAISRASADQRRGRAGRTQPGLCLRLWGDNAPLAAVTPPETQREDLTEMVLAAAVAGTPARDLTFADPPRGESLSRAEAFLQQLGALEPGGVASERGRELFALPVDILLAAVVVAMPDPATRGFMADLAAALTTAPGLSRLSDDADERTALAEALGARCDATLLVATLRGVDLPGVRLSSRRDRDEAQRLAERLRSHLGLDAIPGDLDASMARRAVAAAAAQVPQHVFVRRERRRQTLANGVSELQPGRASLFGAEDEAALVLADHSVPGRGTRETVTVATCMAPLDTATLIETGIANATLAEPELRDGHLQCRRSWHYAGRTLATEHVEPAGPDAREAAVHLILADRLLAPAGSRLCDDIAAWSLYQALYGGEDPVPEPADWLRERLAALGVESSDDLQLVEPDDLRFRGIPDWERARFDERYPRYWQLPGVELHVHYDVRRRRVTVEPAGRAERQPKRWELPAWSGWRVYYRRASREVEIR